MQKQNTFLAVRLPRPPEKTTGLMYCCDDAHGAIDLLQCTRQFLTRTNPLNISIKPGDFFVEGRTVSVFHSFHPKLIFGPTTNERALMWIELCAARITRTGPHCCGRIQEHSRINTPKYLIFVFRIWTIVEINTSFDDTRETTMCIHTILLHIRTKPVSEIARWTGTAT